MWEGDNSDKYPPQVPTTNGGTMEYITGPNSWRHFQVMSNYLRTPILVFCPEESDRDRICANTFDIARRPDEIQFLSNSNLSFFFGVDATETNPASILAGDHNLTNGLSLKNGILEVTTHRPTGWTKAMHRTYGNIALSDGSVRQVYATNLQVLFANSGLATNRLQMPILGP